MESRKVFLAVVLLCFVGGVLSVPVVAPLSPSEEALVKEPEVPTKSEAEVHTPSADKGPLDTAITPNLATKPVSGDLDAADTLLFSLGLGLGYPGFYGGYGPHGYGPHGYGLPYGGWGGYGYYR